MSDATFFTQTFFDVIDKSGSEGITFKKFLKAMWPLMTKAEADAIDLWVQSGYSHHFKKNFQAFPPPPPPKAKTLSPEEEKELRDMFQMYDKGS
jgi:Ca2+-binding EF-hand superfamily protein